MVSVSMLPDKKRIVSPLAECAQGQGVITNVISAKAKAKLRLLYECAPIALIGTCDIPACLTWLIRGLLGWGA